MYLVFDTETNGLPKDYNAPLSNLDNWPRMVQLAWQLYDNKANLLNEGSFIIKPEGFVIPPEVAAINHITTERALAEGQDLTYVLLHFREVMLQAQFLVAHNIGFDEKILGAEFLRKSIPKLPTPLIRIDTMKSAIDFCALPGKHGNFKFPNLTELYKKLFNTGFSGAHDARVDVQACADCLFELKRLGVIAQ